MDTAQIAKEFLSLLPKDVQAFVLAGNWINDTKKISKKYKLTDEQTKDLENEMFVTLLCMDDVREFSKNINESLKISSDLSLKITTEL